jgi:hypothetical protein
MKEKKEIAQASVAHSCEKINQNDKNKSISN